MTHPNGPSEVLHRAPWRFQWPGVPTAGRDALLRALDGLNEVSSLRVSALLDQKGTARWMADALDGKGLPRERLEQRVRGMTGVLSLEDPLFGQALTRLRQLPAAAVPEVLAGVGGGSAADASDPLRRARSLAAGERNLAMSAPGHSADGTDQPGEDVVREAARFAAAQPNQVVQDLLSSATTPGERARTVRLLGTSGPERELLAACAAGQGAPWIGEGLHAVLSLEDPLRAAALTSLAGRRLETRSAALHLVTAHDDPDVRGSCARALADTPSLVVACGRAVPGEQPGLAAAMSLEGPLRDSVWEVLAALRGDRRDAALAAFAEASGPGARHRLGEATAEGALVAAIDSDAAPAVDGGELPGLVGLFRADGTQRDGALAYLGTLDADRRRAVLGVAAQANGPAEADAVARALASDSSVRAALTEVAARIPASRDDASRGLLSVLVEDAGGSVLDHLSRCADPVGPLGAVASADPRAVGTVVGLLADPAARVLVGDTDLRHGWGFHQKVPAPASSAEELERRRAVVDSLPGSEPGMPRPAAVIGCPTPQLYERCKRELGKAGLNCEFDDGGQRIVLNGPVMDCVSVLVRKNQYLHDHLFELMGPEKQAELAERHERISERYADPDSTTPVVLEYTAAVVRHFGTPEYREWCTGTRAGAAGPDGVAILAMDLVHDFRSPGTSPSDLAAQRLRDSRISAIREPEEFFRTAAEWPSLLLGDIHPRHDAPFQLAQEKHLRTLKEGGYTTLNLEGFVPEDQRHINTFIETGVLPYALRDKVRRQDLRYKGHPLREEVLHSARDAGLRIIAADCKLPRAVSDARRLGATAYTAWLHNHGDPGRTGKSITLFGAGHNVLWVQKDLEAEAEGEPAARIFSPGLDQLLPGVVAVRLHGKDQRGVSDPYPGAVQRAVPFTYRPHHSKPEREHEPVRNPRH